MTEFERAMILADAELHQVLRRNAQLHRRISNLEHRLKLNAIAFVLILVVNVIYLL